MVSQNSTSMLQPSASTPTGHGSTLTTWLRPAAQLGREVGEPSASLGPAVVGGLAQGEVRRRVGVGEHPEELVAGPHRQHHHRRRRLVGRDHQPPVAGGRASRGGHQGHRVVAGPGRA